MNLLLSASSPDGSLAAIKAPSSASSSRHLIRIYQVGDSTTTLQSTLTHSSKLPLLRLVFLGTTSVLGLFGNQQVVVWDLDRGVVAATLSASEDQNFLALAASDSDKYYVLVSHGPRYVVHEYQSSNNKLVRKIKSGKRNASGDEESDAASLVVTSSHVIVRAKGCDIRVMDKDTGKKTGKITPKESSTESNMEMTSCDGNSSVLVAMEHTGDAVLYNLDSCKEVGRLSTDSAAPQAGVQLVAEQAEDSSVSVLCNDSLFSVTPGQKQSPEKLTQLSSNDPVALFLKNNRVLALIHERSSEYRVEWVDIDDEMEDITRLDEPKTSKATNDAVNTKKRNSSSIQILGPGQAGSEKTAVKKLKANVNDEMSVDEEEEDADENDKGLTIAERLQMLTDALDEEEEEEEKETGDEGVSAAIAEAASKTRFKPQKATTESLKELLTQALQSSDDSLLELALSVHDVKIIATSIKEMDEDLLVILLGKLTSRLASSPLRAEVLSVWISNCLKRGSFDSDHLAVLRNMLYERIESFSDLLRLEGRLSMMVD